MIRFAQPAGASRAVKFPRLAPSAPRLQSAEETGKRGRIVEVLRGGAGKSGLSFHSENAAPSVYFGEAMIRNLVLLAVIAALALPGLGCGFRRGCSKCNVKADSPPPSYYCPPPACP
jgi:hypothetical protein